MQSSLFKNVLDKGTHHKHHLQQFFDIYFRGSGLEIQNKSMLLRFFSYDGFVYLP